MPTYYDGPLGQKLAYDDSGGAGPLVIAAPGMGDLRQEYRYLTPYLTAAGYRVVTVDIRGFGDSDAHWSDYSAHAVGGDLLGLMTHLQRSTAILAGNSFAAGAALWAAHDAPERVRGLVLLGPVLRDQPSPPWYGRAAMSAAFAGPWAVSVWLQYWDSLFPTRRAPDHAAYRSKLGKNLHEEGRMDALKIMLHLSKSSTEAMLSSVKKPTLVVMGTKDPDFTDATQEAAWVAKQLGAKLEMVEGAGHYPHAEMPIEVGPKIVNFLRGYDLQ